MGVASRTPTMESSRIHPTNLFHTLLCAGTMCSRVCPWVCVLGILPKGQLLAETPEGETESRVPPEPPTPTAGSLAREAGAVRTGRRA